MWGKIRENWYLVLLACLATIAIGVAVYFYSVLDRNLGFQIAAVNQFAESLGQQGDYFGGMLNPIFGLLSFLGILATIGLQFKELRTAREELELTREELAGSKEALQNQNDFLLRQQQENTLFRMMETHRRMANGVSLGHSDGYKAFKSALDQIVEKIREYNQYRPVVPSTVTENQVLSSINSTELSKPVFEGYFDYLVEVIKFADENDLKDVVTIFWAQLSQYEKYACFHYSKISDGADVKKYCDKFGLFDKFAKKPLIGLY